MQNFVIFFYLIIKSFNLVIVYISVFMNFIERVKNHDRQFVLMLKQNFVLYHLFSMIIMFVSY
jgi:hypothetical protein